MVAAKFDTPRELAKVFAEMNGEDRAAFFAAIHAEDMALPHEQYRDATAEMILRILDSRDAFSYVVALSGTLLSIMELTKITGSSSHREAVRKAAAAAAAAKAEGGN